MPPSQAKARAVMFVLALVLPCAIALPQATRPAQAVTEDIVWTTDKEISGDFAVLINQTLTIMNGADVNITGDYRFLVYGKLMVNGTSTAETVFRPKGVAEWGGLEFNNSIAPSTITHAQILDARYGVHVIASTVTVEDCLIKWSELDGIRAEFGTVEVKGTTFNENGAGPTSHSAIYIDNSGANIHDNTMSHNNNGIFMKGPGTINIGYNNIWFQDGEGGYGIIAREKATPIIHHNNVSNNRVTGIVLNDTKAHVHNNTIKNNGDDGLLAVNNDDALFVDNVVESNGDDGLDTNTLVTTEFARNTIRSNMDTGVVVYGSRPELHDNYVAFNDQGLSVSEGGTLTSKSNRYEYNTNGVTIFLGGVVTFDSDTVKNSTSNGVFIEGGMGTFDGCALTGNKQHFRLINTTTIVVNSTIKDSIYSDTNLTDSSAWFYNSSIRWIPDPFTVSTGAFWNLTTSNYLNVRVRTPTGAPVPDAKISAKSPTGVEQNYTTGSDGRVSWKVLVEKAAIHGPAGNIMFDYNPWTINASKGGASNETTVVMNTTAFLEMEINITNLPPTFKEPIPDLEVDEDVNAPKYLDLNTKFEDYEPLVYTVILEDPSKVDIKVEDEHFLSAYPAKDWNGKVQGQVRGTDPSNLSVESNIFNITVRPVNDPPVLEAIPSITIHVGEHYSYKVNATDVDNNQSDLTFSADAGILTIDPKTGVIDLTPNGTAIGLHLVTIRVSDGSANDTQVVTVEVLPATNLPPVITSTPPDRVKAGQRYVYNVQATDPEGGIIVITVANGPSAMSCTNGTVTWETTLADVGYANVTVRVSDGINSIDQSFVIDVWYNPANNTRPVLTVLSPVDGSKYKAPITLSAMATDPDGDIVTVMWYSDGSMVLAGLQGNVNLSIGAHHIKVTASDGIDTVEFHLNVTIESSGPGPGPGDTPEITTEGGLLNEPFCITGMVGATILIVAIILFLHKYVTSGQKTYRGDPRRRTPPQPGPGESGRGRGERPPQQSRGWEGDRDRSGPQHRRGRP